MIEVWFAGHPVPIDEAIKRLPIERDVSTPEKEDRLSSSEGEGTSNSDGAKRRGTKDPARSSKGILPRTASAIRPTGMGLASGGGGKVTKDEMEQSSLFLL
jgi:hypothetical protein